MIDPFSATLGAICAMVPLSITFALVSRARREKIAEMEARRNARGRFVGKRG